MCEKQRMMQYGEDSFKDASIYETLIHMKCLVPADRVALTLLFNLRNCESIKGGIISNPKKHIALTSIFYK